MKNICKLSTKKALQIKSKIIKHNKTKKNMVYKQSKINAFIAHLHEEQKTKEIVIPLKIYQVWHDKNDMPNSVKESIKRLKESNPEFEHHLFDETECRKFIQDNYSKKILHTYDSLVPHALKADLWRYCYLYKNGGIYIDSKYYCINNFKLLFLTDKEYFCKDVDRSFGGIYNAFIICKPKNEIIYKSIKQLVKNVKNKYYGSVALCVGPLMMKSFFSAKEINNFEVTHEFINKSTRFVNFHNYRVLKYHEDYRKQQGDNHWSNHWYSKTLYK